MAEPFHSHYEHLLARARLIDLCLRARVEQLQAQGAAPTDPLLGLVLDGRAVERLLAMARPGEGTAVPASPEVLAALTAEVDARETAALAAGTELRLVRLQRLFGLTPFERDVIVLCLLPELHLAYERLFAFAQDDVTQRRPRVALALDVLCGGPDLTARAAFGPDGALGVHQLVTLHDDPAVPGAPLLGQVLQLDTRIAAYLCGSDAIDGALVGARLIAPAGDAGAGGAGGRARLIAPLRAFLGERGALAYVCGPRGIGRRALACAAAAANGWGVLVVDLTALVGQPPAEAQALLRRAWREARLQGALLLLAEFDVLLAREDGLAQDPLRLLGPLLAGTLEPVVLEGTRSWDLADPRVARRFVRLDLPHLAPAERRAAWQATLGEAAAAQDVEDLAAQFDLTPAQIRQATESARAHATWQGAAMTRHELFAAARAQSTPILSRLAQKAETRTLGWEALILPPDRLAQLRGVRDAIRRRHVVFQDWDFGRRRDRRDGLNILFAGPSGTGKTLAAQIIASDLDLDLYSVDISTVVSKYIGETEKNLDSLFAEAESSNALLFFDEADALFGQRSEVHDAHDRYANIETGYLLQRLEQYTGVVILATNLRMNLDEAFTRRMHFVVEFPLPEEEARLAIWQACLPASAPRRPDIDWPYLARRFKLAGGNIHNIVLGAAFLAAQDAAAGGVIGMAQLLEATRREFQKLGRLSDGIESARTPAPLKKDEHDRRS